MNFEKENFLRTKFITFLQRLDVTTPPQWGKMNVQQMIEHFADSVMIASGKLKLPPVNEGERLQKAREFLMTEKPLRPNTKNPFLSEEPAPLKYNTVQAAIGKLQEEFIYFFETFEKNPGLTTSNPFFGELNFDENIQFLFKHALHHLKQFGVEPSIA